LSQLRNFNDKLMESIRSVMPIVLIVLFICFTIAPVGADLMLAFVIGAVFVILGLAFFTLGADNSMSIIGSMVGSRMTKTRNLTLILILSFVLGIVITIAEPDLQVLATNVPHINTTVLIFTVSVGVGLFLMISMLRILFSIPLKWILLVFYGLVFLIASFIDPSFLSVSFDSGGVTTGPMTVPFIMAMGVGVASIRSDRNAEDDSFGLVALCSIGPILAVLILGLIYAPEDGVIAAESVLHFDTTTELGISYIQAIPHYMIEMTMAMGPIVLFFVVFNALLVKLRPLPLARILVGLILTYLGLVLFLTGVNVGFSSLGMMLGAQLAQGWTKYLLPVLAGIMGWFIINAEPAVHVLNKQVADISAGAISEKAMQISLSLGIAAAMALSMLRIYFSIPILYFMVPGYIISISLSFFVPKMFTAIAFDSGGVASGPMTATFMLPFAMGACQTLGGDLLSDAFGLVAMVAMMPLITVQVMGAISQMKNRNHQIPSTERYDDDEIIELWEV